MNHLADLDLDPDRSRLVQELFDLNSRVHDRAIGLVGPMPVPPDLTMQQVRVLGHVAKSPGITVHEIGESLGVSAPTASGLVDRLVEKDLIYRSDDPGDRRVRRLHPTEAGLDVIRQMDSMFGRALGVVIQMLSVDDLELIVRSSRAMLTALEQVRENAVE